MVPDDSDTHDLRDTVEELRQENERLRQAEQAGGADRRGNRWKAIVSWVLIVVACILAVVSVFVVYARDEVLNTDTYVSTVAPLASNPAVQSAVARRVTERLVAQVNVEGRVKLALPRRAGFLAPSVTSAVQTTTDQIALKLVESPKFQRLWVEANRRAHKQVVALLTGSGEGAFEASDGKVTVDLSQIMATAKKDLDEKGITLFNKVPTANAPTLTVFQSTQLARIQGLTRFLNRLYILLPILTLLLFAGAVVLTANRRRGLVRSATGLALSMGLILVIASLVRNNYLSTLSPSQSKPATEAVIDTVSAALMDTVRTIFIVAAVVAVAALLAGNSQIRVWLGSRRKPSWMTGGPVHDFVAVHRKGLQWGAVGLGLLLLVVWNQPTALVAVVVVLVALALVAIIGLLAGRGRNSGSDEPGPSSETGTPAVGTGPGGDGPVAALGPGPSDNG